jgi:hypothetical protein
MAALTEIQSRVRTVLEDAGKARFTDNLLTSAIRQALDQIDQRLPRNLTAEITVLTTGREQPLSGLEGCLFLTKLVCPCNGATSQEFEPETRFSYILRDGTPTVRFLGRSIPQAGEVIEVHYAAQNTISGLDDAEVSTLSPACENALVNGAAGFACQLRAGSLAEKYGSRPGECSSLLETSRVWLEIFNRSLDGLKTLQEFGFPIGFPLDAWDTRKE